MKKRSTDVAIIGAGTAGLSAFRAARRAGATPLLIEGGEYGTTCARVGCMPSKLLIAAAEAAHAVSEAPVFGVRPGEVEIDGRAVMERVRRERDRFVGFVVEQTEEIEESQRLRGHARFKSPTVLTVDDDVEVHARAVIIATGSRTFFPPELKALRSRVLESGDLFELEELPRSIAVIGPGVIGLELGQALHRLGVRVAFFSPFGRIGAVSDPEVCARVEEVFSKELSMHLRLKSYQVREEEGGFLVEWVDQNDRRGRERFEKVLCAAGRIPDVDGLNLEAAGIDCDPRGFPNHSERTTQCGEKPIFVAGDASHRHPVLHEAADEGRIAGENAARYPDVRARLRRTLLSITFSHPQLAVVGKSYEKLELDQVEIGMVDYRNQGRARVINENEGVVRVYVNRERGCLVGAEMFGPRVEHMAHLLAWATQANLSVFDTLAMPYYHPVVEEGLRTALRDAATKLKLAPPLNSERLRYGPGT